MSIVQGVIGRVNSRQFNGKNLYSFALNDQEGWYGTGVKRPPSEGTSVRFASKKNSRGYLEVEGAIEVRTDGEVGETPAVSSLSKTRSVGSGGSAQSAYWDRRESRDIRNDELRELGATRNTAISIIDLMVKHEAVRLPAVAKREEFLWTLLDRYVDKLRGRDKVEDAPAEKVTVAQSQIDKLVDKITDEVVEEWN